jgi:hypothetical protein
VSRSPEQVFEADRVCAVVRGNRFRFVAEEELHLGLAAAFEVAGVPAEREVRLSTRDRIDFLAGGVGVEVKVDGSAAQVERQLARYAQSPRLHSLVLVTNCVRHGKVARELNGKPVTVLANFGV